MWELPTTELKDWWFMLKLPKDRILYLAQNPNHFGELVFSAGALCFLFVWGCPMNIQQYFDLLIWSQQFWLHSETFLSSHSLAPNACMLFSTIGKNISKRIISWKEKCGRNASPLVSCSSLCLLTCTIALPETSRNTIMQQCPAKFQLHLRSPRAAQNCKFLLGLRLLFQLRKVWVIH